MENRRPGVLEYAPTYAHYMDLVPETDICAALEQQLRETVSLFHNIPRSLVDSRYAPGKWTTREVLGHILDTERFFGFRLMGFARGDTNPFTLVDQELYVRNGEFGRYPMEEWIEEFSLLRKANIALVRHLPIEAWDRIGTVSGNPISVRAIAYFMVAHERHHVRIVREMYMKQS